MSYSFGENLKVSVFGQSHSDAIGVVVDGLLPGFEIDMDKLLKFMERRAPGRNELQTSRKESDIPEFIAGLNENTTCGAPLVAIIRNKDTNSKDYNNIKDIPRPGHADYPSYVKYSGFNDIRGGGQFSGRMTAPLCVAGGILLQILESYGITIGAHIYSIKNIYDTPYDPVEVNNDTFNETSRKELAVISNEAGELMKKAILDAKENQDSVGGIIECAITGLPAGLGGPLFEGLEGKIAQAIFAIPAVKGIEFGMGFDSSKVFGSQHNDPYYLDKSGKVKTKTNNNGGILGGITTGMPVIFRTVIKPTPSIAKEQDSISISQRENKKLVINGRHDPCIVPRAVPVIEAVAAIVISDMLKEIC